MHHFCSRIVDELLQAIAWKDAAVTYVLARLLETVLKSPGASVATRRSRM